MNSDIRPPFSAAQYAFGLDAVVTVGRTTVTTVIVWATPRTVENPVADLHREEQQRIMSISKVDVPTVPRGTSVVVAEYAGGLSKTWVVDAVDRIDDDHGRYVVKPA